MQRSLLQLLSVPRSKSFLLVMPAVSSISSTIPPSSLELSAQHSNMVTKPGRSSMMLKPISMTGSQSWRMFHQWQGTWGLMLYQVNQTHPCLHARTNNQSIRAQLVLVALLRVIIWLTAPEPPSQRAGSLVGRRSRLAPLTHMLQARRGPHKSSESTGQGKEASD